MEAGYDNLHHSTIVACRTRRPHSQLDGVSPDASATGRSNSHVCCFRGLAVDSRRSRSHISSTNWGWIDPCLCSISTGCGMRSGRSGKIDPTPIRRVAGNRQPITHHPLFGPDRVCHRLYCRASPGRHKRGEARQMDGQSGHDARKSGDYRPSLSCWAPF